MRASAKSQGSPVCLLGCCPAWSAVVSIFSRDFPHSKSETLSFICGITEPQLLQLHCLGETRRKERDREERHWHYEEDAAIFSKLVPETGHQKVLNFIPQVSLWDPIPQTRVWEAALRFLTHGGPTPALVISLWPGPRSFRRGKLGVDGKRWPPAEQLLVQYLLAAG